MPPSGAENATFRARLETGEALLLDGALGTELERRGIRSSLPLWSTHALLEAPDVVREVHAEYRAAGAEVLTANTFRTQRRTLEQAGRGAEARALTQRAVALARDAGGGEAFVAGSSPPLEDCYRPDLVPEARERESEHSEHAENLAAAGVDCIAVETMNTIAEARSAAEAAHRVALPFFVSFVCDARGRLLSGERLSDALAALVDSGACALGINCVPADTVDACFPVLRGALVGTGVAACLYPNLGAPLPDGAFRTHEAEPDALAERARPWLAGGVQLLGGCCGTRPAHVAALAAAVRAFGS